MNDHPDLVALLRGELSHADVTEVGDHVDCCDECRHELAETAVGHALLTGTTRTLRRPARLELPEVPPLKSSTSSPRGRAWLRPLGLVAAAAALAAGTAVVSQWAGGSPASRPPWRFPGGPPTWSRSRHRVGTRGDGQGLPRRGADERRDPRPAEDRRGPAQ